MNPQKVLLVAVCDPGRYLTLTPPQLRDTQWKPPGAADRWWLTRPPEPLCLPSSPTITQAPTPPSGAGADPSQDQGKLLYSLSLRPKPDCCSLALVPALLTSRD